MTIARRNCILEEKLPLIRSCVRAFLRRQPWLQQCNGLADPDDLINACVVEIAKILDAKGKELVNILNLDAYLRVCIRGILQSEADRVGALSQSQARWVRSFRKAEAELTSNLHRKPTEQEVAEYLDVTERSVKRIVESVRMAGLPRSLDAERFEDGRTLHEELADSKVAYQEAAGPVYVPGIGELPDIFVKQIVGISYSHGHRGFEQLSSETTMVHFDGHPFLWALKRVLRKAPNLKIVRIPPGSERIISGHYRALCTARDVAIVFGYEQPDSCWSAGENRSRAYAGQRTFLLQLQGLRRKQFEKLLRYNLHCARMTARYFCLQGEEFITQSAVGMQFGFSERCNSYVSVQVNAVLLYLRYGARDFHPAPSVYAYVKRVHSQVKAYEKQERKKAMRQRELQNHARLSRALQVSALPQKFPICRLGTFRKILSARRRGQLEKMQQSDPRLSQVLILRFGLDMSDAGVYRTLQQVADKMSVTRQRVQQLEVKALTRLRIAA
ncbi:MAG: sigma factor-like helix-turn-helix DNA-binding protein [Patescibacteria group bacterium]